MKDKFFKLANNIVKYCFLFFVLIYACGNILFTAYIDELVSNLVEFSFGINILNILTIVLLLGLFYLFIKKDFFGINEKYYLLSFLIICFIVGIIWIFINDPLIKETGDSYNCFFAAKEIAKHNYGPLSYKSYLSTYPNNIGFVTYLLIHIKLFGEYYALYSVRIVNLLMVILGYYSLYGITKKLFCDKRNVNCICIFLMFLSMQYVFYAFMIYGNCLSYSLALFSVYCLLSYFENENKLFLFLASFSIVFSIGIKENSLIVLIAEIIYMFLYFLNKKKKIIIICVLIMLSGTYVSTSGLQKYWGNKVDINYSEIKLPTICWLAYGLNYDQRKPGSYMAEFEIFHVENGYMPQYTKLQAKTFINGVFNEFKKRPSLIFRFYGQKFLISWADPQYDAFDGYRELDNSAFVENMIGGKINNSLHVLWDGTSSVIALGLLFYMFKNFKKIKLSEMLGATIVFGGFLFHFFWEVKSIYLYQYFMYLLPYAAYGINLFFKKGKNND